MRMPLIMMEMPEIRIEMSEMPQIEMSEIKMPDMQFTPLSEIRMPNSFGNLGGMMNNIGQHFRMMDEMVNRLNDRNDWRHFEFRDWSTMAPHSVRLTNMMGAPPRIETHSPVESPQETYEEEEEVWDEDFDSPVLLQSEFLGGDAVLGEEPGRNLRQQRSEFEAEENNQRI